MDLQTIVFYFFVLLTIVAAGVVVFSRNIVHAAFALLFAFFGVAGIYVFLMADFLAVTQLMIYVGGILVLLLFGVMLTSKQVNVDIRTSNFQLIPAAMIAGALFGFLAGVLVFTPWREGTNPSTPEATGPLLGELLLTKYVLPFEVASMVLLVALVGAALIARREKDRKNA